MNRPDGHPYPTQTLLTGLAPVVSEATVLLILGSFPGARSIEQQQYYAHPQNQFWRILQAIWPHRPLPTGADTYQERRQWLLARGLGVWDVYGRCRREGSLDAAIRDAVPNDIASLRLPALAAIAHNGGESFRHARHARTLGVPVHRLPSSSPAHASWNLERKAAAWRGVIAQYLPVP
ncbi:MULTISPECIES: DNA-deoxyinosine glycosylase [unclassified Variovorax]|uniref:DNA-deoxyinosine glycosylase n=1 Tax=unclassified Variovorax TaxID=663243 RepID=UPI000837FCD2|nr:MULTISPECIES: DNA-deoxyinosine glycosylase [unclassified Variovorax]